MSDDASALPVPTSDRRDVKAAIANAKRPKEPDYLGPAELPPNRIAGADYPASEER